MRPGRISNTISLSLMNQSDLLILPSVFHVGAALEFNRGLKPKSYGMADSRGGNQRARRQSAPERIGVFGGSFDPIHIGHLEISREALRQCKLDMVLFVVAAIPPHKKTPEVPVARRLEMVELAIADEPDFHASRIEIQRGGPSYTAETLRELRGGYAEASFFLIVGADSAIDFSLWKSPDVVIEMANVVIAPRPGFDPSTMEPRLRSKALVLESPELDISSTVIRKRLREGKSIEALVPAVVDRYIRAHDLYRG